MQMIFRAATALAVLAILSACGTITRGSHTQFTVNTDPTGADVDLSNGISCKSPCTVELEREEDFTVEITKDGYEPVETRVVSQASGEGGASMAGNLFFGGLIGAGVDATTGAMNDLHPNPLEVNLNRKDQETAGRNE